jgi:uncharacterized protein with HEPN domain
MRDFRLYLRAILAAMGNIEEFIFGMNFGTFQADKKTAIASLRKREIIDEAAKHIPEHIRQQYSQVPWKEMAGLREELIHFPFGSHYLLVWQTITARLAQVKPQLQAILETLGAVHEFSRPRPGLRMRLSHFLGGPPPPFAQLPIR